MRPKIRCTGVVASIERGDHWIQHPAEKPRSDRVGERNVHQREHDRRQPNGPFGERKHGERRRLQVDEERLPPPIAVMTVGERVLDIDEQRQERAAVIAGGGGDRVRFDGRMRLVTAQIDWRVRQRIQVDGRGGGDDGQHQIALGRARVHTHPRVVSPDGQCPRQLRSCGRQPSTRRNRDRRCCCQTPFGSTLARCAVTR